MPLCCLLILLSQQSGNIRTRRVLQLHIWSHFSSSQDKSWATNLSSQTTNFQRRHLSLNSQTSLPFTSSTSITGPFLFSSYSSTSPPFFPSLQAFHFLYPNMHHVKVSAVAAIEIPTISTILTVLFAPRSLKFADPNKEFLCCSLEFAGWVK